MARQLATSSSDNRATLLAMARLMVAPLAGVVSMFYALRGIAPNVPVYRLLNTLLLCALIAAVNTTLLAAFAVWRRLAMQRRRLQSR
jgi:hypothetical protein